MFLDIMFDPNMWYPRLAEAVIMGVAMIVAALIIRGNFKR
jgi:hypothetical protein